MMANWLHEAGRRLALLAALVVGLVARTRPRLKVARLVRVLRAELVLLLLVMVVLVGRFMGSLMLLLAVQEARLR